MGDRSLITTIEPLQNLTVLTASTQFVKIETLKNLHGLYLYLKTGAGVPLTQAQMIADIGQVRLIIGGQEIINLTAAELLAVYHYYHDKTGPAAAWVPAGQLPILFMPQDFPWSGQSKYFRIGMKATDDPKDFTQNTCRLEVTWNPVVLNAGSAVPMLLTDDDDPETIGDHIRWLRFNSTWPTATVQDITDLPKDKAAMAVMGYWFGTAVGTIGQFSVILNGRFRYRNVPVDILNAEQWRAGRNIQAGWTRLGFDDYRDPSSLLPVGGASNLTVSPTWTVLPGTYTILRQEIHRGLVG